jgi:hypothetical protein
MTRAVFVVVNTYALVFLHLQLRLKRLRVNVTEVFGVAKADASVFRTLADALAKRKVLKLVGAGMACAVGDVRNTMTRKTRLSQPANMRRLAALDAVVLEWVTEGKMF